jgi:hypothetical protein
MKSHFAKSLTVSCLIASCAMWLGAWSCNGNAGDISKKSSMQQFYLDNGWIPLPLPDSQYAPGTIFTYEKKTGLRYISSLKTCGIPDEVTAPVVGNSGKLSFNVSGDYGADLAVKVSGVSAGPDWSKIKKTTLTMDDHGPSSMDLYKLQIWLTAPENADKFSPVCKTELLKPNTYVAQESYRVSKGKLTLSDENGAKIAVKGLQAGPVNIGADAHAKATEDGSLEFDQTLYTAVRRLVYVTNGGFQALGNATQPAAKTADAEIIKDLKTQVK